MAKFIVLLTIFLTFFSCEQQEVLTENELTEEEMIDFGMDPTDASNAGVLVVPGQAVLEANRFSKLSNRVTAYFTVKNLNTGDGVELFLNSSNCSKSSMVESIADVGPESDLRFDFVKDGKNTIHARAISAEGMPSACSQSFIEYIVDLTPPNPPTSVELIDPMTKTSLIKEITIELKGFEPGASARFYKDVDCSQNAYLTQDKDKPFQYKSRALSVGSHVFYAKYYDQLNNSNNTCYPTNLEYTVADIKPLAQIPAEETFSLAQNENYIFTTSSSLQGIEVRSKASKNGNVVFKIQNILINLGTKVAVNNSHMAVYNSRSIKLYNIEDMTNILYIGDLNLSATNLNIKLFGLNIYVVKDSTSLNVYNLSDNISSIKDSETSMSLAGMGTVHRTHGLVKGLGGVWILTSTDTIANAYHVDMTNNELQISKTVKWSDTPINTIYGSSGNKITYMPDGNRRYNVFDLDQEAVIKQIPRGKNQDLDRASPTNVSESSMFIKDNRLIKCGYGNQDLEVFDITSIDPPVLLKKIKLGAICRGFHIDENRNEIYFRARGMDFSLIDFSDAENINVKASHEILNDPIKLVKNNNKGIILNTGGFSVAVVKDIYNANMTIQSWINPRTKVVDIVVNGNHLYAFREGGFVDVYDLSSSGTPSLLQTSNISSHLYSSFMFYGSVHIINNYFVHIDRNRMSVFEVLNDKSLQFIDSHNFENLLSTNNAYCEHKNSIVYCDRDEFLDFFKIDSTGSISKLGTVESNLDFQALKHFSMTGNELWKMDYYKTVIYDISNAENPIISSEFNNPVGSHFASSPGDNYLVNSWAHYITISKRTSNGLELYAKIEEEPGTGAKVIKTSEIVEPFFFIATSRALKVYEIPEFQ